MAGYLKSAGQTQAEQKTQAFFPLSAVNGIANGCNTFTTQMVAVNLNQ